MKQLNNLFDLFVEQLKEQYKAEQLQVDSLPKLRAKTTNDGVRKLIDHHIGKTRKQITRLQLLFVALERNYRGEENVAVKGIIAEAFELSNRCAEGITRDAGIIASVQHLNHYNIASYKTLQLFAEGLKLLPEKRLLKESLKEELVTDQTLFGLSRQHINLNETH